MAASENFYFGLFKKIQVCAGIATGYPHCDPASPETLGFNLATSDDKGIFAPLDRASINLAANAFGPLKPLVNQPDPNNPGGFLPAYPLLRSIDPQANVADANPLYAMFKASLTANGAIVPSSWTSLTVPVTGSSVLWPIMPMCENPAVYTSDLIKNWLEFNKPGSFTVVGALKTWIENGKPNDTPTQALNFTKPPQSSAQHPVLFVCSKIGDDGVRPGVNLDYFWSSSRIFLVYPSGPTIGAIAYPSTLVPTDEFNLVAQIGNAGTATGRCSGQFMAATVTVRADAYAFNTHMSTAGVSLPPLSNLDPSSANANYEQYVIGAASYSLAGFRFNVGAVYDGLVARISAALAADPNLDLGGLAPKEWVAGSHPCVKVRISSDANNPLPADTVSPAANPRIAQKNLKMFDPTVLPPPAPAPWHYFFVEQPMEVFDHVEAQSVIRLSLRSTLSTEAFQLFLAIPMRTFRRHFEGNKGLDGFEAVKEGELARAIRAGRVKPFPDAVVLRPTSLSSALELTVDAKHRLLGMSLAIVHEVAKHPTRPTGEVSMVHEVVRSRGAHASAVGGFTIQVVSNGRPRATQPAGR